MVGEFVVGFGNIILFCVTALISGVLYLDEFLVLFVNAISTARYFALEILFLFLLNRRLILLVSTSWPRKEAR